MDMKLKAEEYDEWLNHLVHEYQETTSTSTTLGQFWVSSCWFATVTFDRRLLSHRRKRFDLRDNDTRIQLEDFDFIYRKIASRLNPGRTKGRYPLAIMALDFEGSRGQVRSFSHENVHCHAIFAVPTDVSVTMSQYVLSSWFKKSVVDRTSADSVLFERYNPERDRNRRLVSYAAKGFIKSGSEPSSGEELRIYYGHEKDFTPGHHRRPRSLPRLSHPRTLVGLQKAVRQLEADLSSSFDMRDKEVDG